MADVGAGETVDGRGVVEAPLRSRQGWVWPVLAAVWTFNLARGVDDAPALVIPPLVVVCLWCLARWRIARTWTVTYDGEVVEMTGGRSRWRFRPNDVTGLVRPLSRPDIVFVRARPLERTICGIRQPWPFPWSRAVQSYVRSEWFTDVIGISPGAIRRSLPGQVAGWFDSTA